MLRLISGFEHFSCSQSVGNNSWKLTNNIFQRGGNHQPGWMDGLVYVLKNIVLKIYVNHQEEEYRLVLKNRDWARFSMCQVYTVSQEQKTGVVHEDGMYWIPNEVTNQLTFSLFLGFVWKLVIQASIMGRKPNNWSRFKIHTWFRQPMKRF